ncbi:P-loop containing nucleoside triphosphate hydrolase protein [Colletotrichum cereale]|nr:P-loop containing nucleoside triphosphate hydrolase protein [Colletotrichum cereale]
MAVISTNPSTRLSTPKSAFRLNQIDKIRASGIGDHVSLPQLVVCGDQSAGKSSVLERLTGIPFPRQDGLCTRFATEINLQHSAKPLEITASIQTDLSCSCRDRETLDKYCKKMPDFSALPQTIEEALKLMGICRYMVQAGNDIANQPIITKARDFDIDGLRTVGIITKPDLVNKGTEGRIARLANNRDNIKLGLGFFLLKNPTPQELEDGLNSDDANRLEQEFFSIPAWKEHPVDPQRVGASQLKEYVQDLLYEHIEREIPKVKEEIKQKLVKVEERLQRLGLERPTLHHVRSFLIKTSMRFHQLAQDSLNGHYLGIDVEFFKSDTRLRALVHHANGKFSDRMRVEGSKRKISGGNEEGLQQDVLSLCQDRLEQACSLAHDELSRLWYDERRQPITYNHYFTDNIHKARNDFQKRAVQAALKDAIQEDWHGKFHISNNPDDISRISSVLQNRVVVNMENRACQEGLEGMEAYYKVSRKTFVDNVCRQVVERHILTPLPTFFSPRTVSQLSDEEVLRVGSEPEKQKLHRAQLCSFADRLRSSLKELNLSPPS